MLSHPKPLTVFLLLTLMLFTPLCLHTMYHACSFLMIWDLNMTPSNPFTLILLLDKYSCIMSMTVMYIASTIMLFSITYMKHDPYLPRFTALMTLFISSMLMFILLPNLVTLMIGWDGLGLSSFLLILYYQTHTAQGAGMLTLLTNRLGDIMLLFVIAYALNTHWQPYQPWTSPYLPLISAFIVAATMTKSAQFPFISWLPAAMAAPTPVSALVHSSTLVTAGVFMLVRFYPTLTHHFAASPALLTAAALTCLLASSSAMIESDIKKIIALSTLSQLGTMMYSLAMQLPLFTFFHIITHALFKALLFMAVGMLILYHSHNQDIRAFGNLATSMPLITSMLISGNMALMGMPFLAGFYSKDLIIEAQMFNPTNLIPISLFTLGSTMTATYSLIFLINVLWRPRLSLPLTLFQPHFHLITMGPLLLLSHAYLWMGATLNALLLHPNSEMSLPLPLKLTALGIMTMGTITSLTLHKLNYTLYKHPALATFLVNLGNISFLTQLIAQPVYTKNILISKNLEGGWIEIAQTTSTLITHLLNKLLNSFNKSMYLNLLLFLLLSTLFIFSAYE